LVRGGRRGRIALQKKNENTVLNYDNLSKEREN